MINLLSIYFVIINFSYFIIEKAFHPFTMEKQFISLHFRRKDSIQLDFRSVNPSQS